jgi:hypothetical protein
MCQQNQTQMSRLDARFRELLSRGSKFDCSDNYNEQIFEQFTKQCKLQRLWPNSQSPNISSISAHDFLSEPFSLQWKAFQWERQWHPPPPPALSWNPSNKCMRPRSRPWQNMLTAESEFANGGIIRWGAHSMVPPLAEYVLLTEVHPLIQSHFDKRDSLKRKKANKAGGFLCFLIRSTGIMWNV